MNIFGSHGGLELERPFNPFSDRPAVIRMKTDDGIRRVEIPVCNQYTIQADAFARAILDNRDVDYPLDDAVAQMEVLDDLRNFLR